MNFGVIPILCRVIHPLVYGDYPDIVKERAQTRIPAFTKRDSEQLKGSLDFIGLNHYTTLYIQDDPNMNKDVKDFLSDMAVKLICMITMLYWS